MASINLSKFINLPWLPIFGYNIQDSLVGIVCSLCSTSDQLNDSDKSARNVQSVGHGPISERFSYKSRGLFTSLTYIIAAFLFVFGELRKMQF
jgi:hypothetical protein